jgi:hypothetical protein
MSHSCCKRQEQVDSRLVMVGSQTASLTPGPSFAHNLGCKCPNGQCKASLDIYTSRSFQWHQEYANGRCFGPSTRALNFWESRRLQVFTFGSVGFTLILSPKWGCDTQGECNRFIFLKMKVSKQDILCLLDIGASHNFIIQKSAQRKELKAPIEVHFGTRLHIPWRCKQEACLFN